MSGGNEKGDFKCKYTAPSEGTDLYAPQGVDLGGGGSSAQHGVTQ